MLSLLQSDEELKSLQTARATAAAIEDISIQPYVTFVGDLIADGTADVTLNLIIDKYEYPIESGKILDAINFCFKACAILKIEFAPECKHVWHFFHEIFFKEVQSNLKPYVKVTSLISALDFTIPNSPDIPAESTEANLTDPEIAWEIVFFIR